MYFFGILNQLGVQWNQSVTDGQTQPPLALACFNIVRRALKYLNTKYRTGLYLQVQNKIHAKTVIVVVELCVQNVQL